MFFVLSGMLSLEKQQELKEHLERAQNPIFFFDNDADGLSSFLIIRRWLGRGKGVAVRSYPGLNESYAKRAQELNADYVFILDKPVLTREFLSIIDQMNLPCIWIDHHINQNEDFSDLKSFESFNYAYDGKSGEPVTYVSYKLTGRKEDLWIAVAGCIADHYLPNFAEDFAKEYPELWGKNIEEPFDAYYNSEIGKIAQSFNFGLKDSITNVVAMQNFLILCASPADVFSEVIGNKAFRDKYFNLKKKYDLLIEESKKAVFGKLIFFTYGGETSMSGDVSNEISYRNKDKYVAIGYVDGASCNFSLRGTNVRLLFEKVSAQMEEIAGGGHLDAIGARVRTSDLEKFKELLIKEINNNEI